LQVGGPSSIQGLGLYGLGIKPDETLGLALGEAGGFCCTVFAGEPEGSTAALFGIVLGSVLRAPAAIGRDEAALAVAIDNDASAVAVAPTSRSRGGSPSETAAATSSANAAATGNNHQRLKREG